MVNFLYTSATTIHGYLEYHSLSFFIRAKKNIIPTRAAGPYIMEVLDLTEKVALDRT